MTDEELAVIIESLTTRIENCLSTLVSAVCHLRIVVVSNGVQGCATRWIDVEPC
jgi:hypothetical protein